MAERIEIENKKEEKNRHMSIKLDIISLYCGGYNTKLGVREIARKLNINHQTALNHLTLLVKNNTIKRAFAPIIFAIFFLILSGAAFADLYLNSQTGNIYLNTSNTARLQIAAGGNLILLGQANATFPANLTVDSGTLFVDAAGNRVGIGTLAPAATLDVKGKANFTGNFSIMNASDTIFFVDNTSSSVGIGTTTPAKKLDVAGQMRASGYITSGLSDGTSDGSIIVYSDNMGINLNDESGNTGFNIAPDSANTPTQAIEIDVGVGAQSFSGNVIMKTWANRDVDYKLPNAGSPTLVIASNDTTTGSKNWIRFFHDNRSGIVDVGGGNLSLRTGNTARIFIDNNTGNVGIGTTSPAEKLHVIGNANVSGMIEANTINATERLVVNNTLYVNGSRVGIGTTTPLSTLHINNSGADGALRVTNVSGTTLFFVNGSSGNVGIGTADPRAKFSVVGGISIQDISPTDTANLWYNGDGILRLGDGSNDEILIGSGTDDPIRFNVNAGTEAMRIMSTGSVGIGTTTPFSLLHLNKSDLLNTSVTNVLTLDHTNPNGVNLTGGIGVSMLFRASDNASQIYNIGNISAILYNSTNGSQLGAITFSTVGADIGDNSFGHLTERMRIDGTGRVGIGTISPSAKLTVVGGVNISGGLNVTNGDVLLAVTGGNVGIGTSTPNPDSKLEVNGTVTIGDDLNIPRNNLNVGGGYSSGGVSLIGTGTDKGSGQFAKDILIDGAIVAVYDVELNKSFIPTRNDFVSLGNVTNKFLTLYISSIRGNGTIVFDTNASFTGNVSIGGNLSVDINTLFADADANKVGIGTATPGEKLVVIGNVNISGTLNASGAIAFPNLASCDSIDTNANGVLSCGTDAGGSSQVVNSTAWNRTGTNVLLANQDDRIGIGTGTPDQRLHIVGNVTINDSVTDGALLIDSTNDAILFTGENGSLYQPVYGSDDGLVLYLPFSENTINVSNRTYDRSPYGNDGLLVNLNKGNVTNGTGWAAGKYGYGMEFEGEGDYVDVGNDDSLDAASKMTFEAWVKVNSYPGTGYRYGVAGKNFAAGTTGGYSFRLGDGTEAGKDLPVFIVRVESPEEDVHSYGTTHMQTGIWYHLVGWFDGSNVKIFVNGVEENTIATTKTIQADDRTLLIANDAGQPRYLNGLIDEVRIYKRALSAEEIRTHYLRGSGFGASGAITADKFRVVNTSGFRTLEINQTSFDVKNKSGDSALYIDKITGRVGIGITAPTRALHVVGDANITGRLDVGKLNITGVTFSQGDIDAAGSLKVAGGANISGDLGVSGNIYGEIPDAYKKANVTAYLGDDGNASLLRTGNISNILLNAFKNENFTVRYDLRTDRFARENVTDYLGGTDINASLLKAGNISNILLNAFKNENLTGKAVNFSYVNVSKDLVVMGNVGIGTTAPQNTLDVVGAVTVSKGLNASNLNVTGFSIADDSLVTIVEFDEEEIKEKSGFQSLAIEPRQDLMSPRTEDTNQDIYKYLSVNDKLTKLGWQSLAIAPDLRSGVLQGHVGSNSLSDGMDLPPLASISIKKVKIKDTKAGQYVLSLDESTGKLVPRKVNALLDHGIKPIYEMTTEDGRAINTTAEHPYFIKRTNFELPIGYDLNSPSSFSSTKNPSKSSGLDLYLSNLENVLNKTSSLSCGILNQTTENIFSFGNTIGSVKSKSLVTNTLPSDLEIGANLPFENPFGADVTLNPSDLRNFSNLLSTFSSNRNLSPEWDTELDIISSSSQVGCIVQSCLDMLISQGRECFNNLLSRHSGFNHFQNLPDHDSCSLESGLSMANFSICNNVLINFDSHISSNDNPIFKTFDKKFYATNEGSMFKPYDNSNELGRWAEVRYLKEGMEIAVPDYSTGAIKWVKIASIKALEPQHVYDLSIEGTRNFIANDIVAHNTYLATSSGNVGIGKTNPNYKLDVAGTINASGLLLTNGTFSVGTGGRIGIGTAAPTSALHVIGNVTINDSTRQNSIFIDSEANAILFEGENGSVYMPVYGTDDGLVLYLPFSENAINVSNKTYDRSPYGNDGTLSGEMNSGNTQNGTWTSGKYGYAMSFDGVDDYVDAGNPSSLNLTAAASFTVEAWVKTSVSAEKVAVGYYQGDYFPSLIHLSSTRFILTKTDDTTYSLNYVKNIRDGNWHHIVGIRRGSTSQEVYIDGVLDNSATIGTENIKTGSGWYIGKERILTPSYYFNGTIDEVKIYNRALAPEEIRTHYLRGSGFGASGAITADKFRVVNTSGFRTLEINQTSFDVKNKSGDSALYVDKITGRVGVGITAPTRALHVVGDANITGRLDVGKLNITGVTFSQGDIDAAGSLKVAGGANISGDLGVSGKIGVGTLAPITTLDVKGKANFTGNFSVGQTSNILFVDNTSGRVGIGTTSPTAKLQIEGSGTGGLSLNVTNDLFVNDTSGNVGIGFPGSASSLHIVKDASDNSNYGELKVQGDAADDGAGLFLGGYDTQDVTWKTSGWSISSRSSADGKGLIFYEMSGGASATATTRLTLSRGGNLTVDTNTLFVDATNDKVGIGTTAPTEKLVVAGNANVTGTIYASNITLRENGSLYQPVYGSDDGLVLYLPFSEGNLSTTNRTYDRSPYGNDGKCNGANTPSSCNWTSGKYGYALDFDGVDDVVNISNSNSLNMSEITVSFWLNVISYVDSARGLVMKGEDSTAWGVAYYDANAKTLRFMYQTSDNGWATQLSSITAPEGQWTYVVYTYKSGYAAAYDDGLLVESKTTTTGNLGSNTGTLTIGYGSSTHSYSNAIIDELMIYNRALSADEIRTQYLRGKGFGASGAITADKFRVVNTSGARKLELNQSGFGVYINASPIILVNKSTINLGNSVTIDDISGNVGIGTTGPGAKLEVNTATNVGARITTADVGRLDLYSTNTPASVRNWALKTNIVTGGDFSIMVGASQGADPSTHVIYATAAGKVGIGTTAPATVLDVKGKANFTGNFSIMNASDTVFFVDNTSGRVGIGTKGPASLLYLKSASPTLTIEPTIATNDAMIDFTWPAATSNFRLRYNPDSAMSYIESTYTPTAGQVFGDIAFRTDALGTPKTLLYLSNYKGSVGIGTTAPATVLDVKGKANFTGNFSIMNASDTIFFVDNTSGRVGIGTTIPTASLEVNGIIQALRLSNQVADPTGDLGPGAAFSLNTVSNPYAIGLGAVDGTKYPMWFQTGDSNGGGFEWYIGTSEKMRIDQNGNVGIGTTNPLRKLHVAGDTLLAGTLDMNGSRIINRTYTMQDEYELISYWNFEPPLSNATNTSDVMKINNGSVYGAVLTPDGRIGHAYSFDGVDDYINFSDVNAAEFANNAAFTFEAWVKTSGTARTFLISKADGSFEVPRGATGIIGVWTDTTLLEGVGSINDGNWHHVVATRDTGNTGRFYIDGKPDKEGSLPGAWGKGFPSDSFIIGHGSHTAGYNYNGTVDEVRIYNRALSSLEIEYNYLKGRASLDKSQNLTIGANSLFVDNTNRRVGIGTTNPARRLHIPGDTDNSLFVVYDADGGRVGIGTGSPPYKLHVNSSTSATNVNLGVLGVQAHSTGDMADGFGPEIIFGISDAGASSFSAIASITIDRDGADNNGALSLFTANAGTLTERLRITNAGNVGIGTTRPGAKLEVVGNLSVNGSINIIDTNGSLYQPVYGTDDGLVLYLPFSENAINVSNRTYDRSPYGNDGTLINMNIGNATNGTGWANGKYGYGMSFDGKNDYVSVADNDALDFGNNVSYTASFWFNWKGALGGTANPHIIGKRQAAGGNWWRAYIISDPGTLTIEQENNNADLEMTGLTTSRWYHVGIVRDISSLTSYLYVDGVLKDTAVAAGLNLDNTADLTIGQYASVYFNGTIDEVMLYKRALSADEIRTHYLRGSGFGASGAITADKFRVVNTSGARTLEINATSFDVKANSGSSALYVDKVNNRVGINATSPSHLLTVNGKASISGMQIGGANQGIGRYVDIEPTFDDSGNVGGLYVNPTTTGTPTGQNIAIVGVASLSSLDSSITINGDAVGGDFTSIITGSTGLTVQDAWALRAGSGARITGAGTVTTFYGADIIMPYSSTGATIGTGYGLYIRDQESTGTITNKYALVTEAAAGNVGIGTTAPGKKLTVVGDVNVSGEVRANNFTIIDTNGSLYQPVYGTDDGLVLYLPFSENAINVSNRTYDRSPYGNDGLLVNMNIGNATNGTGWAAGKYGNAIQFDGSNDYVNGSMSLTTTGISFSAWVKSSDTSGRITVIMRGEGSHVCYLSRYDSGKFFCIMDATSAENSAAQDSITSINDGIWHFVTGTNDGSTTRLYVDGVQENSYAETLTTSINMFGVGSTATPDQFFNGTIDEVRIYNRALAPEEIRTHYLRGSGFGASGAITADKFRVVNTSGSKKMELNQTAFSITNTSGGDGLFYVDKVNNRVGIGTTSPTATFVIDGAGGILSYNAANAAFTIPNEIYTPGSGGAADPPYTFSGDDNTGMYTLENDKLGLATSGVDRLVIDSSGNVGIGTTAPATTLDVKGKANFTGNFSVGQTSNIFFVDNTSGRVGIGTTGPESTLHVLSGSAGAVTATGTSVAVFEGGGSMAISLIAPSNAGYMGIVFGTPTSATEGQINYVPATDSLEFVTGGATSMFISGSNVGIGTTHPVRKFDVSQGTEGATVRLNDTTEICDLDPDATAVTETCSSDARLKENIKPAKSVLNYLTGLPIKDFTVKASGENATGVIAQDLLENYPELVSMDEGGYYMVKSLSPWLFVKAIQEQQAQIEELKKEIEQLKKN